MEPAETNKQDRYLLAKTEVGRHLEDCESSKLSHFDMADIKMERYRSFTFVKGFAITGIIGWLVANQFGQIVPFGETWTIVVSLLVSLFMGVVAFLETYLNYLDQHRTHRIAADHYQELRRNCLNWQTDYPDAGFADEAARAARQYRERLNSINREAPHITQSDRLSIERWKKTSGRASDQEILSYDVDESK